MQGVANTIRASATQPIFDQPSLLREQHRQTLLKILLFLLFIFLRKRKDVFNKTTLEREKIDDRKEEEAVTLHNFFDTN